VPEVSGNSSAPAALAAKAPTADMLARLYAAVLAPAPDLGPEMQPSPQAGCLGTSPTPAPVGCGQKPRSRRSARWSTSIMGCPTPARGATAPSPAPPVSVPPSG
jgi:hypothetical protein